MWRPQEKLLFDASNTANNKGDYRQALLQAEALLVLLSTQPVKRAYVLGCRKAVALAHLGRYPEADNAFAEAFFLAKGQHAWAIAAYIVCDWTTLKKGSEALEMAKNALELLERATETPDPQRVLALDVAYCKGNLGRIYSLNGNYQIAKSHIQGSRHALEIGAHDAWPRYAHAYLIVLYWELSLYKARLPWTFTHYIWTFTVIVIEAIKQHKLKAILRTTVGR